MRITSIRRTERYTHSLAGSTNRSRMNWYRVCCGYVSVIEWLVNNLQNYEFRWDFIALRAVFIRPSRRAGRKSSVHTCRG